MNTNLDRIALDLYGKIETRFPDIKIGDENATVLSKKTDIPKARFFEFEYKENGRDLGTVAITLDEDDGIVVQIGGELSDSGHSGAFKFIRSFRQFAKDRLLNFDVQNIGKSELDKRDYEFQAKPKELPAMAQAPIMENKMYGTSRMSYQDLGEAKLIVKHTQPVNLELAAGRTMHIESIWVENAQGERFKYPYKHLNGARALAEHLKHGGNLYDNIGQHICSLSEELTQLRKFKGYVGRNDTLAEAMGDITEKVMERIEQIKKEVQSLQRPTYYEAFAESFASHEDRMIPEEIMSDWIDRLTIRTFNEDLKTAFPYIFRLVDETQIPVKGLSPDDLLDESHDDESEKIEHLMRKYHWSRQEALEHLHYNEHDPKDYEDMEESVAPEDILGEGPEDGAVLQQVNQLMQTNPEFAKEVQGQHLSMIRGIDPASQAHNAQIIQKYKELVQKYSQGQAQQPLQLTPKMTPEDQFEAAINRIMGEDMEGGENTLFSPNKATQADAIDKLNQILQTELKGGPEGINAIESLKGIIDNPEFLDSLKDIDPDLDARPLIQQFLTKEAPEIVSQLHFGGEGEIGGANVEPEAPPTDMAAPAVPPAPEVPPAPAPGAEAGLPPQPAPGEGLPGEEIPPAPVAEGSGDSHRRAGMIKAIHKAKQAGAKLDTKLDFGHKEMTLHDCMKECGMAPQDFGYEEDDAQESGVMQMLKDIAGFWNHEAKNFTIGGTRAKVKVVKGFKDGAYGNASDQDLHKVIMLIDKMDPTGQVGHEHHGHSEVDDMHGKVQDLAMMSQMEESKVTYRDDDSLARIISLARR